MSESERSRLYHKLVGENKGILFKVAGTYCRDRDDIQDLIQEISLQVWRSIEKYNSQYKASTWLYRISINVAISFHRKNWQRKDNTIPLTEGMEPAGEVYSADEEQRLALLEQFISDLGKLDKALMLLYLDDKSYHEISDILGISKTNVGTKIARIKEKLKTRFSQSKIIRT